MGLQRIFVYFVSAIDNKITMHALTSMAYEKPLVYLVKNVNRCQGF